MKARQDIPGGLFCWGGGTKHFAAECINTTRRLGGTYGAFFCAVVAIYRALLRSGNLGIFYPINRVLLRSVYLDYRFAINRVLCRVFIWIIGLLLTAYTFEVSILGFLLTGYSSGLFI